MQATRRGRMGDLYAAIATGNIVRVREFVTREPGLANAATETPPPLHWALLRQPAAGRSPAQVAWTCSCRILSHSAATKSKSNSVTH